MTTFNSACGLACPSCECYLATKANDAELKKDIAVRWSKNYDANLSAEDIYCDGCMSDGAHFAWCGKCPIRACVIAKGYENCSPCAEFPCDKVEYLHNAVAAAKAEIEKLRG